MLHNSEYIFEPSFLFFCTILIFPCALYSQWVLNHFIALHTTSNFVFRVYAFILIIYTLIFILLPGITAHNNPSYPKIIFYTGIIFIYFTLYPASKLFPGINLPLCYLYYYTEFSRSDHNMYQSAIMLFIPSRISRFNSVGLSVSICHYDIYTLRSLLFQPLCKV